MAEALYLYIYDSNDFFLLLLIAGICGAMGQAIGGYSRGGCLVSIALGFIGAILGMAIANSPKHRFPLSQSRRSV